MGSEHGTGSPTAGWVEKRWTSWLGEVHGRSALDSLHHWQPEEPRSPGGGGSLEIALGSWELVWEEREEREETSMEIHGVPQKVILSVGAMEEDGPEKEKEGYGEALWLSFQEATSGGAQVFGLQCTNTDPCKGCFSSFQGVPNL